MGSNPDDTSTDDDTQEPEGQSDEGLQSCADAILSAVEAKDSDSLVEALSNFLDIYEQGQGEEPPDYGASNSK